MSINVARNQDNENILNINQKMGTEAGIKLDSASASANANSNAKPFEPQTNNLQFMMNEDANFKEPSENSSGRDETNSVEEDNESINYDNNYGEGNNGGYDDRPYEDIEREKAEYLSKLHRHAQNPQLQCRRLDYSYSLEEIKAEYFRCEKDLEIIRGVMMYRSGLSFLVGGMEWGMSSGLNMKTMDGWSNIVNRDINSSNYDQVLADIYEIWGGASFTRPEVQLVFMLGMSGLNYHNNKKMANQQQSEYYQRTRGGMRGPAEDTDEILKNLDNQSDISSASEAPPPKPAPKKRGRKKKYET